MCERGRGWIAGVLVLALMAIATAVVVGGRGGHGPHAGAEGNGEAGTGGQGGADDEGALEARTTPTPVRGPKPLAPSGADGTVHAAAPLGGAAKARVDALREAGDAAALLELYRDADAPGRLDALGAHLQLAPPTQLPALVQLLADDQDPLVHALLGEAFATRGEAEVAEQLVLAIDTAPEPSAIASAAMALIEIGARADVAEDDLAFATETLEDVARAFPDLAPTWARGLGAAGEAGAEALSRLAGDARLPDATRLAAAVRIMDADPTVAGEAFTDLAARADDETVRAAATSHMQRLRSP
jgi:hypothetical protein